MSVKAHALCYRNQAKLHVDIPLDVTDYDVQIDMLINSASRFISNYCKREFNTQTITEYHDGRASNRIILRNWPITGGPADGSKPRLALGDPRDGYTDEDVQDYYVADRDMSIILNRTFPKGYRNILVEYEFGLGIVTQNDVDGTGTNTFPDDLVYACLEMIAWLYHVNSSERVGVISRGKGDERTTYEQMMPQHVALMLETYIREDFSVGEVGIWNV